MHSQVIHKSRISSFLTKNPITDTYIYTYMEKFCKKLGWCHYISEQYKDIPSNSASDLITIGKKDGKHFTSTVIEL